MTQESEARYVSIFLRGGNVIRFASSKDKIAGIIQEIQDYSEVGGRLRMFEDANGEITTGYLLRDVAGFQVSLEPWTKPPQMNVQMLDELIKEQVKQLKEGDDWKGS